MKTPSNSKRLSLIGVSVILFGIFAYGTYMAFSASLQPPLLADSNSEFDAQNRYILRDYDLTRPMSNFLNGLATVWGIPLWAFYVNRGQAITSFGKQNKDAAIAKFVTVSREFNYSRVLYMTCVSLSICLSLLYRRKRRISRLLLHDSAPSSKAKEMATAGITCLSFPRQKRRGLSCRET